jgi:hypothetical protein
MALSNPLSYDSHNIAVFRTYHNYAEWLFIPASRHYCNYYRHATTLGDLYCLLLQGPPLTGNSSSALVAAWRLVLTSLPQHSTLCIDCRIAWMLPVILGRSTQK